MQEKLNSLYNRIGSLESIYSILGKNSSIDKMLENIDGPFLLSVDKQYLHAKPKIIFVGQENNGWVGSTIKYLKENGINETINQYQNFDFEKSYSDNFFRCMKKLREEVVGLEDANDKRRSIIWSNLFKFNQGKQPQMNWSEYKDQVLLLQGDIFQKEIEILTPDAVVFVTGPYYDEIIKIFYPDVSFEKINEFPIRQFAWVKSQNLPEFSVRTYHPEYAMGKGKKRIAGNYYEIIIEMIKKHFIL